MGSARAESRPSINSVAPMRACILGTAGHIDHGKSSLVKALTGTDPDRLPEEQARGMTIELGFAQLRIPINRGELKVSIVDVPGHERFVRTMVSGATGIDIGMLVVAADDGVMPQTCEHVEILNLLGIEHGLIALSKVDLVLPDKIAVVTNQISQLVQGTSLADWRIVPCSARNGAGLDEVRNVILKLAQSLPRRNDSEVFRLAIDRVFAVHGRGTVVTGSTLSGTAVSGTELELLPLGLTCRVREVQTHGTPVEGVGAGQRAAINLTGVDREQIERGMELATPRHYTPTRYLDAQVRIVSRLHMKTADSVLGLESIKSHRRVRLCMGTRETMAVLVVIGASEIACGQTAMAQLRCAEPVVAEYGQRFIIRDETASHTIGGGFVIRPVSRRFRPHDPAELAAVSNAASDEMSVRLDECLRAVGFEPVSFGLIATRIGASAALAKELMDRLRADGKLVELAPGVQVHVATLDALAKRGIAYLSRHHSTSPLEPGVLRDRFIGWLEARSAPGCGRVICSRIEASGEVITRGPYVAHREFRPALSKEDSAFLSRVVAEITDAGFDPPIWGELQVIKPLSKQRSKVLEDLARSVPDLVAIAPGQFISRAAAERLKKTVTSLGMNQSFKLAEVRDRLGLSRRVVQPLLEYLDRIQFTRRVGDERVLVERTP